MNTIETERLVLRRFAPQDAAGLFAYLQAPIASCFLSLTLADLNDAARAVAERGADDKSIAVCLRSTGQLIGDLFAEPEGDTFSVGWNFNPQERAAATRTRPRRRFLPIFSPAAQHAACMRT